MGLLTFVRDRNQRREPIWQWVIRLLALLVCIAAIAITAKLGSQLTKQHCHYTPKMYFNIGVGALTVLVLLTTLFLTAGPARFLRALPYAILIQLLLDLLLLFLWAAATGTAPTSCTDICGACPALSKSTKIILARHTCTCGAHGRVAARDYDDGLFAFNPLEGRASTSSSSSGGGKSSSSSSGSKSSGSKSSSSGSKSSGKSSSSGSGKSRRPKHRKSGKGGAADLITGRIIVDALVAAIMGALFVISLIWFFKERKNRKVADKAAYKPAAQEDQEHTGAGAGTGPTMGTQEPSTFQPPANPSPLSMQNTSYQPPSGPPPMQQTSYQPPSGPPPMQNTSYQPPSGPPPMQNATH